MDSAPGPDSNWTDAANWRLVGSATNANTFPTSAGDVALFTLAPSQTTVTVNATTITVGEIDFGTASNITIAGSGSNALTLQNTSGNAVITAGRWRRATPAWTNISRPHLGGIFAA